MRTRPISTLAAALADLQARIARGEEFPDAAYRASREHDVDQSALEAAYDEADLQREATKERT